MNTQLSGSDKMGLCYFLIILAVASRLLPHPLNFAPIGALGLFSGAYIQDRRAWLIPLAALFISDVFIGFYDALVMLSVYLSFALSAIIGRLLLSRKRNVYTIGGSALVTATILFVLSNFALWATGLYYPMTATGLVQCYLMAVPFYGNSILGDLFYAALLFGAYEGLWYLLSKHQRAHVT
jgi:hypothetical protein